MTYETTPKQDQAIREWLQEAITPLIEQVLVKKIGQAMSFAAGELVQPKREWVGLTDEEREMRIRYGLTLTDIALSIEAKLKEKNHDIGKKK